MYLFLTLASNQIISDNRRKTENIPEAEGCTGLGAVAGELTVVQTCSHLYIDHNWGVSVL